MNLARLPIWIQALDSTLTICQHVPVGLRQCGFIFFQPNRKELINEKTIHFYQHGAA